MTQLLEKAFAEAARLPAQEQDALATWIIEELNPIAVGRSPLATQGTLWIILHMRHLLNIPPG